ncbi:uncharacterized protein [Physcomitrium patens]|uniref:uncharacterized protein isoform X3 n=1 Tax=Physcomitrium patens TaxID=3218 RepID=UPI000D166F35|nr:uncharacterized protein LOC112280922 isoform X3 [Physcomitrium patens]|eukprot:XP_024372650.1 uncharacterized protein LOC112280922 isoform X3 [Physcomitrella patens]
MKVVVPSGLCLWLVVLFSLVWGEAVVAINRPGINPFPDVSVGQSIALRPLADGVFVETSPGVKPGDLVACMRVRIHGIPRFSNIQKFAVVTRVKLQSEAAPAYRPAPPKVEVCMHRNGSMEVAQCSKESWRALEQGFWSGATSPFETKYVDLRLTISHTDVALNISVEEEVQGFRIAFLVLGILLLLLAPSVSDWLPFYYSSAMTLGVFLVIIVLLYQGMKLLPTGRNNSLFIVLYGLLLGMGSVVVHYFSARDSTLLEELGLSDDMYNPVSTAHLLNYVALFLGLGVVLIGAWVGFWGVRKMVLAEDGNIDSGVAKFVKWAIRIIGGAILLQSSCDVIFSGLTLAFGLAATWVVGKFFNLLGNLEVGEDLEQQWSEYWDSDGVLAWAGEKLQKFWSKRPTMRRQYAPMKQGVNRSPLTKMQANPLQNLPEKDALTRWEQVNTLLRRNLTGRQQEPYSHCSH